MNTKLIFKNTIILFAVLLNFKFIYSQNTPYNKHHDVRQFHLGFSIGMNYSDFRMKKSDLSKSSNLYDITAEGGPGINLGIITNLKISDNFDLVAIPSVSLQQRTLKYNLYQGEDFSRKVDLSYLSLPLLVKFKGNYYKNTRLYVLAGCSPKFNLASDAKSKDDPEKIKIKDFDFSVDFGVGFNLYGERIKLSPEIRYSAGLVDIYNPKNTNFGENIDQILTHTLIFSINFE